MEAYKYSLHFLVFLFFFLNFEIITDPHAIIRNNTRTIHASFTQFPPTVTSHKLL